MYGRASATSNGRGQVVVAVALAAGILLALTCAISPELSAAQPEPDTADLARSTTQTATAQPVETPTPAVVLEAPSAGVLLQQYLDEQYGPEGAGTAWHANIRRLGMRFGTVVVQTDLADGPEADEKAAAISQAVLGFRLTSWGRKLSGLAVEVYGQGGALLAQDRVLPPTPGLVQAIDVNP